MCSSIRWNSFPDKRKRRQRMACGPTNTCGAVLPSTNATARVRYSLIRCLFVDTLIPAIWRVERRAEMRGRKGATWRCRLGAGAVKLNTVDGDERGSNIARNV